MSVLLPLPLSHTHQPPTPPQATRLTARLEVVRPILKLIAKRADILRERDEVRFLLLFFHKYFVAGPGRPLCVCRIWGGGWGGVDCVCVHPEAHRQALVTSSGSGTRCVFLAGYATVCFLFWVCWAKNQYVSVTCDRMYLSCGTRRDSPTPPTPHTPQMEELQKDSKSRLTDRSKGSKRTEELMRIERMDKHVKRDLPVLTERLRKRLVEWERSGAWVLWVRGACLSCVWGGVCYGGFVCLCV